MTAADWSAMEAGVAYVRTAAAFGHPPYTVTEGYPSPEQPLGYQLSKTAETVWAAVSSGQSGLVPYLVPVRNYMTALAAKVGIAQARDFAPGCSPSASARRRTGGRTTRATTEACGQGTEPGRPTCACCNGSTKWRMPSMALKCSAGCQTASYGKSQWQLVQYI